MISSSPSSGSVILVVDDDEAKRYSAARVLERAGYEIVEASSGAEALACVERRPALVILDIRLPDMTGYEVCRRLKNNPCTSFIPVLHVSATFVGSEDKALGLNLGADGYLTYPIEPNELLATVRALIRLHDAESAARAATLELQAAYTEQKRIAEMLQRSLLIKVPEDAFSGLEIATFYEAAWEEASVGGDFYDTYRISDTKLALVVGDATGKGLAAATRTAEVKFALRAYLHQFRDPAVCMAHLNTFLCDSHQSSVDQDTVIALAIGIVDLAACEAIFTTAAAERPLVLRSDLSTSIADTSGLPVGAFHGAEYRNVTLSLSGGDTIVMATDGITEARRDGEFLSYEGMVDLAKRHLSHSQSIEKGGRAMLDAARDFAHGKFQDDVCILLAKMDGHIPHGPRTKE